MVTATTDEPIEERRRELLTFYKFFEPVEELFFNTLRARFPEMSVKDAAVCRAVYIHQKAGGSPIRDRRVIWELNNTPIFPTDESFEEAIRHAMLQGYIDENEEVRPDIEKCLDEVVDNAVRDEEYISNKELFVHEQMLADAELQRMAKEYEDDRRHTTGLS